MKGQLTLFENENREAANILEKYVDYSNLGKTQAMERDLNILEDFINYYGETILPLLDSYLRKVANASTTDRR